MPCLLKNEPASPRCFFSLSHFVVEAKRNRVLNARFQFIQRRNGGGPETRRANHEQGEFYSRGRRRPEPVSAAKGLDDLWLEVICQSGLVIAGSPRNIYRYSLLFRCLWGQSTEWSQGRKVLISIKLRIPKARQESQSYRAKLIRREGNIPDWQIRSLNCS